MARQYACMVAGGASAVARGVPKSERDAARLDRFNRYMQLPIVVSAILPLIVVPQSGTLPGVVVGGITWLVFLIDLVVHLRLTRGYLRTGLGSFDLIVVLLTSPWYLLPGASAGALVNVLRLARLARLLIATRGVRRLLARLGRVAIVAGLVVVVGSAVAYGAEHPTNPGFATFGDALWWGIVTLTTVGYGDIVPKTTAGRLAGIAIMLTGIAVLGVLAGSLASLFGIASDTNDQAASPSQATVATHQQTRPSVEDELATLPSQLAAVQHGLGVLEQHIRS